MSELQSRPTDASENPALADSATCALKAKEEFDDFRLAARASGLVNRWRGDWMLYYARDNGVAGWGDNLYPEGEEGEKVRMRGNMARSLIRHLYTMTVAQRPVVDPKAKNSDVQSSHKVEIGRAVADEYLKTKKVYRYIDHGVELALVEGAAFVHGKWNEAAGGLHAAPPDDNGVPQPIPRGDCEFNVGSPLDVGMDLRASDWEAIRNSRLTFREWQNRFELAAKYPEATEAIMDAPTRGIDANTVVDNELPTPGRVMTAMKPSDLIEVCYYYQAKTAAVPNGRMLMYLQHDGTPLEDKPLPYEKIPVFRISAAEVLGSPIGYAVMTELACAQEALDKTLSAIATRFFAFGIPNVVGVRGSSPDVTQLPGGANFIEVDPDQSGRPTVEVLDLLQIKPEMFTWPDFLTRSMGTFSGVNAVVQGNPPPGLDAGVAIAQFQAMAVQFASTIQASYAECVEDVVLWIFEALRVHSESMPRTVQLVGKSKRQAVEDFYGGDLDFQGVTVDMGNPLSRTAAGKAMIADYLRNSGIPVTAEQFVQVLNTGTLEPMSEGIVSEMDLVRQENEMLSEGQPVHALRGENHALHIREHRAILSNPDVKFNEQLLMLAEQHLSEHEQLWMMGDPLLGIAMGAIPMGAGAIPPPNAGPSGGPAGSAPHGAPPHPQPGAGAPPGGASNHPPMHPPPGRGPGPGELPRVLEPPPIPGSVIQPH
jgi:hypothetical protein